MLLDNNHQCQGSAIPATNIDICVVHASNVLVAVRQAAGKGAWQVFGEAMAR